MKRDVTPFSQRDQLDLVREREVAARWKKSIRTLQRWRLEGFGPPWITIGGTVHYRVRDILAFEDRNRRGGGTSQ